LNTEVKEREEEREGRWAINLQPAYAQEPRKFMREIYEHALIVKSSTII